jgi:FkbM family methyltransferase
MLWNDVERKWWELFWWAEPHGQRIRVRNEDGVPVLYCPEGRIEILSSRRWSYYKRGLSNRLRRVAAAYGVPDLVSLRPGDLVVDIGANIGEFSLYATNAGASVIAIEPDPFTFQRLCANARERNMTLIQKGLWEKPCTLRFNIAPAGADGSFINPSDEGIDIDADTLDNVLADHPGRIRFIKADAEGAEPELLRGAARTLERTEYIGIDCTPERLGQYTDAECAAILRAAGFEIIRDNTRRKVLVAKNTRLHASR